MALGKIASRTSEQEILRRIMEINKQARVHQKTKRSEASLSFIGVFPVPVTIQPGQSNNLRDRGKESH